MDIGIIILAAGASSRMGQSKQLLPLQGTTLLERIVTTAQALKASHTVVVLGANEKQHAAILKKNTNVQSIVNPAWQNGMGSSLKTGLQHLLSISRTTDAIIILVCDQPAVTTVYLEGIVGQYKTSGKAIIASFYSGSPGVPALFDKTIFPELLNMDDNHGAKKIIQKHEALTELIPFPEGSIDLDTPEDYHNFVGSIE